MRKNRILKITIGITIFISILLISFSAFATNNSTSLKALNSMNKGYQAYQSHDFQKAIKHLKKCYQLIPYSKAAYYLSCCYYKLDDSNNARSYAVHALKDKPKLSRAYTDNVNTIIIWAKDIKDSSSNSVGSSIEMNGKADV